MSVSSPLAIEASGLVKSFGEVRAVDGVDLAVRSGSVYGVLGPNGAGKTTTIRMLATLLRPDARHRPGARPRHRARGRRGARPGQPHRPAGVGRRGPHRPREPDPARPPARAAPRRRQDRARPSCSRRSASTRRPRRLVKNYSGGMRRRLDIAASIVVTPELMFLDEPTTGLDPRSRNQVWDIVRALVGRGHDDPALHPVPRRGRPARRRHRRDRPRHGDRRGHAGPAQGVGRRRARCTCGCSTPSSAATPSACSRASSAPSTCEPDPAALSAPVRGRRPRRRGGRRARALGRADRRLLARPAEPRRGLPRAHRPHGRGAGRDARRSAA